MCEIIKVKRFLKSILPLSVTILMVFLSSGILLAQRIPSYSFVTFSGNYSSIIRAARADGYQVTEKEIKAVHGTHYALLEKGGQFYSENISLFFNERKELIYFSVGFELNEGHSQRIIEKLVTSMSTKLNERYGENEREIVPYFRIYENNYEIHLYPPGSAPTNARISFKQLDRYSAYQAYYREEVERLENEEIAETVENL